MIKYSEKQVFMISKNQKNILQILDIKYKINVSQFIRDAIKEKIERDSKNIFRKYKEFQEYLKKENDCPF